MFSNTYTELKTQNLSKPFFSLRNYYCIRCFLCVQSQFSPGPRPQRLTCILLKAGHGLSVGQPSGSAWFHPIVHTQSRSERFWKQWKGHFLVVDLV